MKRKLPLLLAAIGAASLLGFGGCASANRTTSFHAGSPRNYGVETGSFAEAPPFGPRLNNSGG